MKLNFLKLSAIPVAVVMTLSASQGQEPQDAKKVDACLNLVAAVEEALKAEDAKVLEIVAAKIKEAPDCACEITKAAIRGTKASKELTGQIVEAAVRAAPDQYKTIVECAVAVNGDAVAEIRAALQNVFGGKDGDGGKIVVVPPAVKMNPALAMAFILNGITPSQGLNQRADGGVPGGGVVGGNVDAVGVPVTPGGFENVLEEGEEGGGEEPPPPFTPPPSGTPSNPS